MKRTFQIALFAASDAAKGKVLASLHAVRAAGAKLARVPTDRGPVVEFFDYEHVTATLRATLRLCIVTGVPIKELGFASLWGCDAVVFIPSGKADAAAVAAATKHFASYGSVPVLVASAKPVSGMTGIAVPATGAPLAEAIEREVIEAFRAKRIKGRATTPLTKAYVTRAKLIAEVADIALELGPPKMKPLHEFLKASALHPALGFDKVQNLTSIESGLFSYWNEAKGPHVTKFWAQVAQRKLPYTPR